MLATRLRLRDFRSYAAADVALGAGLTVVHGRNGAGKTNLLEALYFGCTGRSCRTSNERELVRFDAATARVEVELRDHEGRPHALAVGFTPGDAKRLQADGVIVDRLVDVEMRPLVCVFMPDRLELVKGPPALRRSHVDQVIAASWPARSATPRASPPWAPISGWAPRRSCAIDRAHGPPTPPSSPPSSPSAWTPTSSAASPATGRIATTSRCCAAAASCAPTARRASSAWPCWPCCSPSGRRW